MRHYRDLDKTSWVKIGYWTEKLNINIQIESRQAERLKQKEERMLRVMVI